MKKKLEEFLELEKKATAGQWIQTEECIPFTEYGATGKIYVCAGKDLIYCGCIVYPCDDSFLRPKHNAQFIAQSRTIAPQAVNKLMEAVELLEKASGLLSSELGCTRQLHKRINEFLEDFNDENQGL